MGPSARRGNHRAGVYGPGASGDGGKNGPETIGENNGQKLPKFGGKGKLIN